MLTEICMVVIALSLAGLVTVLIWAALHARKSVAHMQSDLHKVCTEAAQTLATLNAFIHADLHPLSHKTGHLISTLQDLSSDINDKSHCLNALFKPISFINSKLGLDSPGKKSLLKSETVPQLIKWITSSIFLFKTTKEFIKNYEK